jgi:hypothetical protein
MRRAGLSLYSGLHFFYPKRGPIDFILTPCFFASPTGYASITYIVLGYGPGHPKRHYPLDIAVYYVTNASANVTIPINALLRDEYTACLGFNIDQPPSCVSTG